MTNHYWDRVSAPHADRDRSEPWPLEEGDTGEALRPHEHCWTRHQNVTSKGYVMPAYEACECGAARKPAARDDDNAPSDRERAYAEEIDKHWPVADANLGYYRTEVTCFCGETYWGGDHDVDPTVAEARALHIARACVAVEERHTAELRERLAIVEKFINQRPEYVSALRNSRGESADYHRWSGHAEARRQLATLLGMTVPHEWGDRAALRGPEPTEDGAP